MQAEFEGTIVPGREYVLVDDFVGMGGTLANLKGHIESNILSPTGAKYWLRYP